MSAVTSDLPGVADLTGRLASVDQTPGVVLVLDRTAPDGSAVAWERGCHALAGVTVHPDLLGEDGPVMAGILAHEVAHHRADAPSGGRWPDLVAGARPLPLAAAFVALWMDEPKGVVAALLAVAAVLYVVARLGGLHLARVEEFAADAYAVLLLDACDLPGRDCTRAALEAAGEGEPWLDRWLWPFSAHPTVAQRLAALDRR